MDKASQEIVYKIIAREIQALCGSDHNGAYLLTQEEIDTLCKLDREFYARIYTIAPDVHYYNGYFLPIRSFEISVFWHKHGMDTFKTLPNIREKNIIDVGGFVGDSALILQDYTDKSIYTFEATKTNYNLILKTLRLNRDTSKIIPINKGLGSSHTTMQISIYGGASSFILNLPNRYHTEEAEIITLDSYVKEHNLEIGFIKVDIEGFEMEFLKGAKNTICEQKPAMLISIYHQASDFFEIKPLLESWDLGYTFRIYKPIDYSISVETALLCEVL